MESCIKIITKERQWNMNCDIIYEDAVEECIESADTFEENLDVDCLYEEVLTLFSNTARTDYGDQCQAYFQKLFNVTDSEQKKILDNINNKVSVHSVLNVNIVQSKILRQRHDNAKNLVLRFYLKSKDIIVDNTIYQTSVWFNTLNPRWNENFTIKSTGNLENLSIHFELWKIPNLSKSKDIIKSKEWVVDSNCKIVGWCSLSLKDIRINGKNGFWLKLNKNKNIIAAEMFVKLNYSIPKSKSLVFKEHQFLLDKILRHDIQKTKIDKYQWFECLSLPAKKIIKSHTRKNNIEEKMLLVSKWMVYCNVHHDHPMSFALFNIMIQKIQNAYTIENLKNNFGTAFEDATRKMVSSCLTMIYNIISEKRLDNQDDLRDVKEIMSILNNVLLSNFCITIDSINTEHKQTLKLENDVYRISEFLKITLENVIAKWFLVYIDECCNVKIDELIAMIGKCMSDLELIRENYDDLFILDYDIKFSSIVYKAFGDLIYKITKLNMYQFENSPDVRNSSSKFKIFEKNNSVACNSENINQPDNKKSFDLYVHLQRYSKIGTDCEMFFYPLFVKEVQKWFTVIKEISIERIKKSIQLDKLERNHETSHFTVSVVDTITIFHQIINDWKVISWPNSKESSIFMIQIFRDINELFELYGNELHSTLVKLDCSSDSYFNITNDWIYCLHNLYHLEEKVKLIYDTLWIDAGFQNVPNDNIKEIESITEKLVKNIMSTATQRIVKTISIYVYKPDQTLKDEEDIKNYIFDNLDVIEKNIIETKNTSVMTVVWAFFLEEFRNLITENKKMKSVVISRLISCLNIINECKPPYIDTEIEELLNELKLKSSTTSHLISEYFMMKWNESSSLESAGKITIKGNIIDSNLTLEILNATMNETQHISKERQLSIKVNFYPYDVFEDDNTYYTNQCDIFGSDALSILVDEVVKVKLSSEQLRCENSLIMFTIENAEKLSVGQSFLSLLELQKNEISQEEMTRMHLKVVKFTSCYKSNPLVRLLKSKKGDDEALAFLKYLKSQKKFDRLYDENSQEKPGIFM